MAASPRERRKPGEGEDEELGEAPKPPEADFELPPGFDSEETAVLVKGAQSGESAALNELFARYHTIISEIARRRLGPRLRNKEDPQDLAQTTFREATRDFQRYEYRGPGSLLRWLIQILQNKIRDKAEFYSAGKRDSALETALDAPAGPEGEFSRGLEPPSPDLSVTRLVQRDERYRILREALAELPNEYRQAIALVFFEGLSLREAGQRLGGRSEDALRMMLRRAEKKLGEILKRNYDEV
jgi:RNA polymerase sigma-70 factor (ECF subfamily)